MSKIREDYEKTLWSKIENFVNGTNPEAIDEISDNSEAAMIRNELNESIDEADSSKIVDGLDTGFMEEAYVLEQKEVEKDFIERQEALHQSKNLKRARYAYSIGALFMALAMTIMLIITASNLPRFGGANNPANNEVPQRYIEQGMQETGTVNVVTGLILNYRGFDTMGETHVLFIAASTVMILLLITKRGSIGLDYKEDRSFEPKNDVILKKVATFLVPVIAVFGIYVVLNGHISPGGGFSGGAILGAGLILYVSAFGFKQTEKLFNERIYVIAKVSALCCYVCCLSYYFFMGANGFNNHIPLGTPGAILSSGLILFIDIFVGTEVACTMYAFYALFRRGEI